jgi:hypothetical protein
MTMNATFQGQLFSELTDDELIQVDGGADLIQIALTIGGIAAGGVAVYNLGKIIGGGVYNLSSWMSGLATSYNFQGQPTSVMIPGTNIPVLKY